MKTFNLSLILVMSVFSLNAQMSNNFITYTKGDMFVGYNYNMNEILSTNSNIEGSPYVFDSFRSGIVYSRKDKEAYQLDININAYTHQFEFEFENSVFAIPNYSYDSVIINQSTFIPVYFVKDDKVIIIPLEILDCDAKGNYLLKKDIVIFSEKREPSPYKDAEPAKFKNISPQYYFKDSDNRLIALKRFKKLPNYEGLPSDVYSYIKMNKIKRKNEVSLEKLFQFVYAEK